MMLGAVFLSAVLLPFVAARPEGRHPGSSTQRRGLGMLAVDQSQFDFLPYELRDICFDCTRPNPDALYSCQVKFDWFDPNSTKDNNVTACSCAYSWSWDGVTTEPGAQNTFDPKAYIPCLRDTPVYFEMALKWLAGANNFSLAMSHHYKDTSIEPNSPYSWFSTYAYPQLSLPLVLQEENSMTHYHPGPIFAKIVAID